MLKQNLLLAFLLSFILITSVAVADHKPTTEYDGLSWSQLPTICGTTEAVNEYLVHNEFELENLLRINDNLEIIKKFAEKGNWCYIIKKKNYLVIIII